MTEETLDITAEDAAALGEQLTHAFDARTVDPGVPIREPDETWELDGGSAYVYRVPGNDTLTRPVIVADGFGAGSTALREWNGLWGLEGAAGHAWGSQLHERGQDVIVLGYDSRNAPIVDNAEVAIQCIRKAATDRSGDAPLVVGGLSMGGLVTRYALAKMERDQQDNGGPDHETAVYFSYDSPHMGAWIPISLQVFAHFLAALADTALVPEKDKEAMKGMSRLINSDAARELLWRHISVHRTDDGPVGPTFVADARRQAFLDALAAVGDWPQKPHRIAVANGRGDGIGLVPNPDELQGTPNLVWPDKFLEPSATLNAQPTGDNRLTAKLVRALAGGTVNINTSAIPALDFAPGGTLNSFGIAAHALAEAGFVATAAFPDVCFVPVASAVDVADPSDPYAPVDPDAATGLHAFKVASQNEGHTLLTAELCDWLCAQFDRP